MRKINLFMELCLRSGAFLALSIGMIGFLLQNSTSYALLGCFLCGLTLVLFSKNFFIKFEPDWAKYSTVIIISITIAKLGWVLSVDSMQPSDFGVYFKCGNQDQSNLIDWINSCQSNYMKKNVLYWTRSLFYTAPLGALFGKSYFALKIFNFLLHFVTLLMLFFGLRSHLGNRSAFFGILLLGLNPEWWFSVTIATTDNLAILCILGFLLLVPKLHQEKTSPIVLVALPVLIFLSNQLRTIGPLLLATLVIWCLLGALKKQRLAIFGRFLFVFVTYALAGFVFGKIIPWDNPERSMLLRAISIIDFSSSQDFSINYMWLEHFWPAVNEELRDEVGLRKIVLELTTNFSQMPLYMYKKALNLFSGTGYYGFATFDFSTNADTVLTVSENTVTFNPSVFPILGLFVLPSVFLTAYGLIRKPIVGVVGSSIIWTSAFSILMLAMGEAQPRYSLLIVTALAVIASSLQANNDTEDFSISQGLKKLGLGISYLTLIYGVCYVGATVFSDKSRVLLQDANLDQSPELKSCTPKAVSLIKSPKSVRVHFKEGSNCSEILIPIKDLARKVSFFVSGSRFPYPFEEKVPSPFIYEVSVNQKVLVSESLGLEAVRWYNLDLPTGTAKELRVQIQKLHSVEDDYLDLSLMMFDLD